MASQLDMFGGGAAVTEKPRRKLSVPVADLTAKLALSEAEMAAQLEATGNYKILRRLDMTAPVGETRPGYPRIGIIVDTETTGLKKAEDEVIEIGAIAFRFDDDGMIGDIIGTFGALQQPTKPIPPEISKLTGITDEMVAGQAILIGELEAFVTAADLIVAHNAAFDRPFCERLSPVFADKAWCCSNNEIDWRQRGFEGTKLGYLLNQSGLFHDGHRAVDDCFALLEVLRQAGTSDTIPFAELLAASRKSRIRLWAEHSPFDKKDILKARGYRWSPGEDQEPKAWWTEVGVEALDQELTYLREEIYGREDIDITTRHLTAANRFKS